MEPRLHTNSTNRMALQFIPNTPNMDDFSLTHTGSGTDFYSSIFVGPRLSNLASTVAAFSQIVPMKSDFANQTYGANFTGPGLKCGVDTNVLMYTEVSTILSRTGIVYLAWIGDNMPWGHLTVKNFTTDESWYLFYDQIHRNYTFLTYLPDLFNLTFKDQTEMNNSIRITTWQPDEDKLQIIKCELWNTTYEVEFTYQNFEQNTITRSLIYQDPILTIFTPDINMYYEFGRWNTFPKAIFSAFASLIVGFSRHYPQTDQSNDFMLTNVTALDPIQLCQVMEETFRDIVFSLFSLPEFS